jgi:CheY-like chemotaxis protein
MFSPKAKILVVDDDPILLDLLTETLTAIGYNVESATDGFNALEILQYENFDIVVSDIKMPKLDGFGLLTKIRDKYPKLPVLFITGVDSPEIIGQATPNGFLAKPFRINHIEELIEKTLRGEKDRPTAGIKNVMVVDDDETFREMLAETLRYNEYFPVTAVDGEAALIKLEQEQIDAVITDIKMPKMDGLSLLRQIKNIQPDLPVILVTAYRQEEIIPDNFKKTEAAGYLKKPFKVQEIISLLKDLSG